MMKYEGVGAIANESLFKLVETRSKIMTTWRENTICTDLKSPATLPRFSKG
jgi:hypothetical protein